MGIVNALSWFLRPVNLDRVFSEEGKELTALGVAARFSRGNINVQYKRVTTPRMFAQELARMKQRVDRHRSASE
jgi:hypothetical protein